MLWGRRAALGLLGSGLVAGCVPTRRGPDPDLLRFRLTLEVLVDGEIKRGSSVRQYKYTEDPKWFPSDGAGQASWQGEALPVPLGGGAWLFAMLEDWVTVNGQRQRSYGPWNPYGVLINRVREGDPAATARYNALKVPESEGPAPDQLRALLGAEPLELTPAELPILVAFRPPLAPRSGFIVHPEDLPQDFPNASWGACTVQASADELTFGQVAPILPWIEGPPVNALQGVSPTEINFSSQEFSRNW